jgi:hypothetical protein
MLIFFSNRLTAIDQQIYEYLIEQRGPAFQFWVACNVGNEFHLFLPTGTHQIDGGEQAFWARRIKSSAPARP